MCSTTHFCYNFICNFFFYYQPHFWDSMFLYFSGFTCCRASGTSATGTSAPNTNTVSSKSMIWDVAINQNELKFLIWDDAIKLKSLLFATNYRIQIQSAASLHLRCSNLSKTIESFVFATNYRIQIQSTANQRFEMLQLIKMNINLCFCVRWLVTKAINNK